MVANNRSEQKKERELAAEEGRCTQCCSRKPERKPELGKKQCRVCIDRDIKYTRKRRAKQKGKPELEWCVNCHAWGFHRSDCGVVYHVG